MARLTRWALAVLPLVAGFAWAEGDKTVAGLLEQGSREMAVATSELGRGNLEGASVGSGKAFDLLAQNPVGPDAVVAGKQFSDGIRLLNHEPGQDAPKTGVPQPAVPGGKDGGVHGVGREVGQFVGGIFGSLTGWYLGGAVGSQVGQKLAELLALEMAKGMVEGGNILGGYGTYFGAATAGSFLGAVFGTVSGYVIGAVAGSAVGSQIGKWFDRKKKS